MAKAFGMALAPFNVLAGGEIRSDEEEQKRRETGEKGRSWRGDWERTETEIAVCHGLEKVAKEVGAKSINAVAIAYVMQKTPYVFPIIGGRKVEHLQANIEALDIRLEKEHIEYLESLVPFDKGFPYNFIGDGSDYYILFKTAGHFQKWPIQEAIKPA
ncbi:NADP-dependent oxidoreductase domain superfamily protein, partial [Abortiporus biennis]